MSNPQEPSSQFKTVMVEGGRVIAFAFRLVLEPEGIGIDRMAIPDAAGKRPQAGIDVERQLTDIIVKNLNDIPPDIQIALRVTAHLLPVGADSPFVICEFFVYLSMREGGGAFWEIVAKISPVAECIPACKGIILQARDEMLDLVCNWEEPA